MKKYNFDDKFLFYALMSPNGISKPYITVPGLAINGDIYRDKSEVGKLVPF